MKNSTSVTPSVLYVDDLITKVERGALKVPAFQRSYVWSKKNVIELFESIYHGFPIGSVLLWETETKIKINNNFDINTTSNSFQYILDGQQRLTTLYHCLNGKSGADDIWNLYIDLEQEIFLHLSTNEDINPCYFPISKVLNTFDFLKESQRLLSETNSELLVGKAQELANRIRKYKLAIINLEGGDLDDAIEIFTRLNKTGMQIIPIDLITALNYDNQNMSTFDLTRRKFIDITKKYSFLPDYKVDDYVGDTFIKLLRIGLGFQIYAKNDTEKVASLVRSENFDLVSEKIITSYENTLNFIVNDLKFLSQSELPYVNLLYMTFSYYFKGHSDIRALKDMFYKGSIAGLFNVSPSGTENLLNFFSSNFNKEFLTKKLLMTLNNDYLSSYIRSLEEGEFNARSALGKVTYNILSNKYLKEYKDSEVLKYPPIALYNNDIYKERLGNKCFFISLKYEEKIYSHNEFMSNNEEKIIKQREKIVSRIVRDFLTENEIM